MRKFKSMEVSDFSLGQKVITVDDFEAEVVMVYKRYVDIMLPDGHIRVVIPGHAEIAPLR